MQAFGKCGLFCELCANKKAARCKGCVAENLERNKFEQCKIYQCTDSSKIESCLSCNGFPCQIFLETIRECPFHGTGGYFKPFVKD